MNPEIQRLHPYPFEKLMALKSGLATPAHLSHIALSIGEPRHAPAEFVAQEIQAHLGKMSKYPITKGTEELRAAVANWLQRRFKLPQDSIRADTHVLPVSGTREGLFSFAQAVIDRSRDPLVVLPNPFYQIYEGAALLAGAQTHYLNTTADTQFIPDFRAVPDSVWQRCQLLYICSPGNPTGAVIDEATLQYLIGLADRFDFILASDECYSEIYFDESKPPVGLLQAAANMGREDYARCIVFHSLSKRSNVPGLRSGFVAGDANIIKTFLKYRTYHGCAIPEFIQKTSCRLWADEEHVIQNRELYRKKFAEVLEILGKVMDVSRPEAGFYLWPQTGINDEDFAKGLFAQQNITVLPGSYLSREAQGINPGRDHVRIALVAELAECLDAANRISEYIKTI